ncbi:MAG: c-type cytochrome [Gallionellaceae bacterium]|nr:c-type cytochrome [Gallionellaceae bacterium]
MLHAKTNIVGLALVILLLTTTAWAGENSDQANKGRVGFADDSPESIKLRSGSGDPVAGKDKSELCQGCHGEDGNSVETSIPKLSGQYAKYVAKQLRNYQAGKRSHAIMSAMAATMDDTDLADIAAYFASQNKMKGKGSNSSNRIGKNLFLNGDIDRNIVACINCHGVDGKGKAPNISLFPVIGGQHKSYLLKELNKFREGARSNSPGGIMSIMTETMSDAELEALADFSAGL